MLHESVNNYLSTVIGLPFFYFVGDNEYSNELQQLLQNGLTRIRVSDFCSKDDKFPNIDDLIDEIRTSDVDYKDNKLVVVGLGEYLALKGQEEAVRVLSRLKNTTIGNSRVIFLLRGIATQVATLSNDTRIFEQHRLYVQEPLTTAISITNIKFDDGNNTNKGIKKFLFSLEDGAKGHCQISSVLDLENSLFPVTNVDTPFAILKLYNNDFSAIEENGSDEQWGKLLKEFVKYNQSLDTVFERNGIKNSLENLYDNVSGFEYKNWLYFLALKLHVESQKNTYIRYVLDKTIKFEDFRTNILTAIIDVNHNDRRFDTFYQERKKIVKEFDSADVAIFIHKNAIDPKESIYRFTDNTLNERKAIISWVSKYGWNECIAKTYPGLYDYSKKYVFDSPILKQELTSYFEQYKKQKITNQLSTDFLDLVYAYAKEFKYAKLPTRDSVINAISEKNFTHLHWIDALGVEYLSYIAESAKRKGLSLHVEIARADLPTITEINKKFYDSWTGQSKQKEERLDQIKHKEQGGYLFTDNEEPIHLAAELDIIEEVLKYAATELSMHKCKKFVIASDHGASRLAVIKKQEEKYETDTKGEHSGRCCKMFDGCDLEFCIPENGYLVLSDYGRFKGSRKSNVEVHGGATLEEIVVPVITLSLKNQAYVEIEVLDKDAIVINKNIGVTITLYISDVSNKDKVSLLINDIKYVGTKIDASHYSFELPDIKRAKSYSASVYDGEDLIGTITFNAKGKTGSVNSDFDDLF